MDRLDLTVLMKAPSVERVRLLSAHSKTDLPEVAEELHALCYEAWTEEPSRVAAIVEVFDDLCRLSESVIVTAHAEWSRGIRALVDGKLEESIQRLDLSQQLFSRSGDNLAAANTQTAKLYALALLGRYDEAVNVGLAAREVFLENNDLYATGKIEHNIGNLYWRRDMYGEAKPYLASAHGRFQTIGDQRQLAMVENSQAFVCTLQNELDRAEQLYKQSLARVEDSGFKVTAAEIEIGLSNMYLFEGRFDAALAHLESARETYEKLGLKAQSMGCRLEIADVYSEIGLFPEAIDAYHAAAEHFGTAGMRAELARCLLGQARALIRRVEAGTVEPILDQAADLYEQEGNRVACGAVWLARAEASRVRGDVSEAVWNTEVALDTFERSGNERLSMFAGWLLADLTAELKPKDSIAALEKLLAGLTGRSRDIEFLCRVSLGRLTKSRYELTAAVDLIETSRATLAADELRMAFFAARVIPYHELTKIELDSGNTREALIWHERSRARVLADLLQNSELSSAEDQVLKKVRQGITWFNNRIHTMDATSENGRRQINSMQNSLRKLEQQFDERSRQVRAGESIPTADRRLNISELRQNIGEGTLVEYAFVEDELIAFVVTSDGVDVVRDLGTRSDVTADVRRFLFHVTSGRILDKMSERSRDTAGERLAASGRRLYETLIAPLQIKSNRVVIVPAGALHQLPFGALHNGNTYLAAEHVISYSPSLLLLQQLWTQPASGPDRAVVAAVQDKRAPMISEEATVVRNSFNDAVSLVGDQATLVNLVKAAANADIVHLACHGQFRRDNPGFSSLHLADHVCVKDLSSLKLKSSMMVLSACESGLNATDAADDLVGLTSAFFAAGAATLVMSLWRVDDAAALGLMKTFYSCLRAGRTPAEAMTEAQRSSIAAGIHPFLWSQFIVSGRS